MENEMATTQKPVAPASSVTQWRVDPVHTRAEFAVKHLMITTVRGHFADVDGTVHEDAADPNRSSIEVSLKTASVDTGVEQRDAHLRSADFFDAEQFPSITFRSTKIATAGEDKLTVTGDLTIKGISKPVVLDVTEEGRGGDPWGGQRAGFSATTKIDRRDFGLNWNQALEKGGWAVAHEVKINLDIQLIRQD
jgi:polyisoprenoid-binding protein YceI